MPIKHSELKKILAAPGGKGGDWDGGDWGKGNGNNPFELYRDDPKLEEATEAIQDAIDKAVDLVAKAMKKYEKQGATDTMSRDAIWDHMIDKINRGLY